MSDLYIHGIGTCAAGFDDPSSDEAPRLSAIPIKDYLKPVQTRRFGRVAKLMYVAASRAVEASGISVDDSVGIVTATAMGEVDVSLSLIEQIHRTGGVTLSPKLIPNSVHNSPAGYMTIAMKTHGPAITLSQGWLSVEAALCAADDLISSGTVQKVLLVVGDEYDPDWAVRLKKAGADELAAALETQQYTEGAIALVLSTDSTSSNLGNIRASLTRFDGTSSGFWSVVDRIGYTSGAAGQVHARKCAGGSTVMGFWGHSNSSGETHFVFDEGWEGSSLTGALAPIVRHIRAGENTSITTIGHEVDELGLVHWRRELIGRVSYE